MDLQLSSWENLAGLQSRCVPTADVALRTCRGQPLREGAECAGAGCADPELALNVVGGRREPLRIWLAPNFGGRQVAGNSSVVLSVCVGSQPGGSQLGWDRRHRPRGWQRESRGSPGWVSSNSHRGVNLKKPQIQGSPNPSET